MASKYTDVVPLKDISASSVAEGIIEVFSRTGIPRVILSDQGSQFLSALVKQLYSRLGISQMKTLPIILNRTDTWRGCMVPWCL